MTPLERAAQAIRITLHLATAREREAADRAAHAVLQAIREPSEEMTRAFVDQALHGDVLSHGGWPGYARDQWQAMIDQIIGPEEK